MTVTVFLTRIFIFTTPPSAAMFGPLEIMLSVRGLQICAVDLLLQITLSTCRVAVEMLMLQARRDAIDHRPNGFSAVGEVGDVLHVLSSGGESL